MLSFNKDKKNCTGCSACYACCPVDAITMKSDEEGFLYPNVTEKCIHCGLCERVCPSVNSNSTISKEQKHTAIAYCTTNYEEWKKSTSGGAFSAIVKLIANDETIIFGAAWDGFNVQHVSTNMNDLSKIQKSKYISSNLNHTFREVKRYLLDGKSVVFTGCPCQVAGLKFFLRKEYANLFTIDFICHGQGSPIVFNECLRETEDVINEHITNYEFRAKRKVFETEYISRVETKTGCKYLINERFTQLYLRLLCVRPSCGENCSFHSSIRYSDITLADCKCIDKINTELRGYKYNYSTIISNTQKGKTIVNVLKKHRNSFALRIIEDIVKYNPNLIRSDIKNNEIRDIFFKEFIKSPKDTIVRYTSKSIVSERNLFWRIFDSLPICIRKLIIIIYKII